MLNASGITNESLEWLLETESPGVRYLALRDLLGLLYKDTELEAARQRAHIEGPIAEVLTAMQPEGYWSEPGPGYNPKYYSSVWAVLLLAQLGASVKEDERVQQACAYLMEHALTEWGQFSASGTPSSTADCLQGNLCWALTELGYEDERLGTAFDWMARTVTGEGVAPMEAKAEKVRYYAGKCGPNFACGSNNRLPCAWGAAKVMLALSRLPLERRTGVIERAIQQGVDFLFSVDPATAAYPTGYSDKPSGNWWKLGFPVFYVTDVLQILEALAALGYGKDARLANTIQLILDKRDNKGRWALEYSYAGKTWVDFGGKKQANPWVTLRALRALQAAGRI